MYDGSHTMVFHKAVFKIYILESPVHSMYTYQDYKLKLLRFK